MIRRDRRPLRLVTAAACLAAAGPPAGAQPAVRPRVDPPTAPTELSTLQRVLRRFDFEEAEEAPHVMPINFYRHLAPDRGFPPFGRMHLTSDVAYEGRWSFEFELDGGSMSAAVPTAVLPVFPGVDYSISARIRTEGLANAAARIAAQLYDEHGLPIAGSRAASPLVRTGARWRGATIHVFGTFEGAASLVIELQVLQPQQFARPDGAAVVEDIAGRAWFDDVVVRQEPRIELSTDAPANVAVAPRAPTLHMLVRDPTTEHLEVRLRIDDIDGTTVHEAVATLPRGTWTDDERLDSIPDGWYRATLEVRNADEVVGHRALDLVIMHPPEDRIRDDRFGVVMAPQADPDAAALTRLLARQLAAGSALVRLRPETVAAGTRGGGENLRAMMDDLLQRGATIAMALPAPATRDEGVEALLMSYGLAVSQWLVDFGGPAETVPSGELADMVQGAADALADFVAQPAVLVPWSADYEAAALPAPHGCWITIPHQVRPESIGEYASRWRAAGARVFAQLEPLPGDVFGPGERACDLMLRALEAWRSGVERISIPAPWRAGDSGGITPEPALAMWRTLADHLDGRRFEAELAPGPGLHAWLLAGPGSNEAAVVAWNESAAPGAAVMRLRLADGPVDVIDAFGGRRRIEAEDGRHTVALGPRPLFVEGVDLPLARFRAAFRITPSRLAARHQVHDCRLELANPWDETITGSLKLEAPAGWRVSPRLHEFTIAPGGTAQLPISLVFNRQVQAGPAPIAADIDLIADRGYRLRCEAGVETGMENIEFAAHWRPAPDGAGPDDLIVSQSVTNTGTEAVNLTAFVSAPGMSRMRREIGFLGPDQTAVRSFRLVDGARLLAGKQVHLGVTDRDGARLNRTLEIPADAMTR